MLSNKLLPPEEVSNDELILEFLPLVNQIAGAMVNSMPTIVPFDDLVQNGRIGLIEAARRFEPSRGTRFEHFADRRIRGAMIDGLRKDAWPRCLRKDRRKI